MAVRADRLKRLIKLKYGEYAANLAEVNGVKSIIVKF